MSTLSESAVRTALSRVDDPEIGKPITELGMVKSVTLDGNNVAVEIYLTIAGCPLKNTLIRNTQAAVEELDGVGTVTVTTDVMSDEQRRTLRQALRGTDSEPVIPFAQPNSTTRVLQLPQVRAASANPP